MLPQTLDELQAVKKACSAMVKRTASVSAVTAITPIPGVDIAADIALLTNLLSKINRKFGLTPEQIDELDPQHKAFLLGVIKKAGTTLAGTFITEQLIKAMLKKVAGRMAAKQVLKYIPFAGQAAAAALSAAAMMYVGNSCIDECYEIVEASIQKRSKSKPRAR